VSRDINIEQVLQDNDLIPAVRKSYISYGWAVGTRVCVHMAY